MNRKTISVFMVLIAVVLFAGCSESKKKRHEVIHAKSDDVLISYVEDQIYYESGDRVTAKIVSKKQLRVPTVWFDGPMFYVDVLGGNEYEFEIINNADKSIIASAYYSDGFICYDDEHPDGREYEADFSDNYIEKREMHIVRKEFIEALDKDFDTYYVYKDVSNYKGLDVFICSTDYEVIDRLLESFKQTVISHKDIVYVSYSVYIYKDEKVFNNTDFKLYIQGHASFGGQSHGEDMIEQYTGKQVDYISCCYRFDQDFFESDGVNNAKKPPEADASSYSYLVFWYDAEPNSYTGVNSPFTNLYGVK